MTAVSTLGTDGKWSTVTTVDVAGGTAQFKSAGLPMSASMLSSSDPARPDFTYDVSLTLGTQKWSAKRIANQPASANVVLRYGEVSPLSSGPGTQTFTTYGYAFVPLTAVTTAGAAPGVTMRIDYAPSP
jgi:hypothetical protein